MINLWKKNKSPSYTHFNLEGTYSKATSKTDIADTLGETFCHKVRAQRSGIYTIKYHT